jgi:signal transduction histidine kinase
LVDKERTEHVFDNLLSNALRHTDRGGQIILGARAREGFVEFSIGDTGEGIPAAHLSRVFDKFFRTPSSKRSGGAGLGLAIVREIITAHGGLIHVRSSVGKGTTFTFTLPTRDDNRRETDAGINGGVSADNVWENA